MKLEVHYVVQNLWTQNGRDMSNPCLQPFQLIASYPDSMEEPSREVRFIKQTMKCLRFSANTFSIKHILRKFHSLYNHADRILNSFHFAKLRL